MTREEILQFVSGSSKYRSIYENILAKDSLLSTVVMNDILKEEPQNPTDLCLILDLIQDKYSTILVGGPSKDESDLRKAKVFLLMKAALVDGPINNKESDALSQMVNAYEYRVPDLDIKAIASQYSNGRAEAILQEAKYGDRIRLLNSIDYIFKADGPLQEKEIVFMQELFSQFDIKPDAASSFNFEPKRVYGIQLGPVDTPAPSKRASQTSGQGMSRDDILETTGRIRDLQVFHDILTGGTAGAERLYEAVAELNITNPMMLTSYLLQNKDELLVYCDDEASRVRTAKTALLMFAAFVDGRSEKKDALLADIADNKIHVYNFEWNQANTWHDDNSEWSVGAAVNILSELPLEEKVDIYNDVLSIFEADGGELSESKKQNLGYLRDDLGLDGDSDEEETDYDMDEETDEDEATEAEEVKADAIESKESTAGSDTSVWTCPNCGHSENRGKFCEECGAKKPEEPETWTCPQCGQTGNKGKFCSECGAKRGQEKAKPEANASRIPATPSDGKTIPAPRKGAEKKAETASKHQAAPVPKPTGQTATINSVKADHNYELDLDQGVFLHVDCGIVNCKGTDCVCGAWLFYADGTPVNVGTNTPNSAVVQVADTYTFTPENDDTHFDDIQLFIPYSKFICRHKGEGFYLIIQVQTLSGVRISSRHREDVPYSDGTDPSCFTEVLFEDYGGKELRVTAKLAAGPGLNRSGEVRLWIHWPDGTAKWNKNTEKKYKTEGGHVSVNRRFTSGSAGLLTGGIGLSLPYSAMGLDRSMTYRLTFRVGIRFEDEEEWTFSEFVPFSVQVKKHLLSNTYQLVK